MTTWKETVSTLFNASCAKPDYSVYLIPFNPITLVIVLGCIFCCIYQASANWLNSDDDGKKSTLVAFKYSFIGYYITSVILSFFALKVFCGSIKV